MWSADHSLRNADIAASSFDKGSRMEISWQKLFHFKCMTMLYLIQYVKQI